MNQYNISSEYIPAVLKYGLTNQRLISRCLDLGMLSEAKKLQQIDKELSSLLYYKEVAFNFIEQVANGQTLLVGEGNLSFSLSLARNNKINPMKLITTTFEMKEDLSEFTKENTVKLQSLGASVIHGVDATKLAVFFRTKQFNNIVFQFPHTGNKEPVDGKSSNFILVCDFLRSAVCNLSPGGKVLISVVDNSYYRSTFQLSTAAEIAGFDIPKKYPFEPGSFPGYIHTMTNEDASALENHKHFATWVFQR